MTGLFLLNRRMLLSIFKILTKASRNGEAFFGNYSILLVRAYELA